MFYCHAPPSGLSFEGFSLLLYVPPLGCCNLRASPDGCVNGQMELAFQQALVGLDSAFPGVAPPHTLWQLLNQPGQSQDCQGNAHGGN